MTKIEARFGKRKRRGSQSDSNKSPRSDLDENLCCISISNVESPELNVPFISQCSSMDMTDCPKPLHHDNEVQFSLLSVQNILRSLRGLEPHCVRRTARLKEENPSAVATVVSSSSSSPSRLLDGGQRVGHDSKSVLNMLAWCDDADDFDGIPLSFPTTPSATAPRETPSFGAKDRAASSDFEQFSLKHCETVMKNNLRHGASMSTGMSSPKSPSFYMKSRGIRRGVTSIIGNYEDVGLGTCCASASTDSLDHCAQSGAATHSFRPIANPLQSFFIVDEGPTDGSVVSQIADKRKDHQKESHLSSAVAAKHTRRAIVEQFKPVQLLEHRPSTVHGRNGIIPTVTARREDGNPPVGLDDTVHEMSSPPCTLNQSRISGFGLYTRSSSRRGSFGACDSSESWTESISMSHDRALYSITTARGPEDPWKYPQSSVSTLRSSYCGKSTWTRNSNGEAPHRGGGGAGGYRPVPDQSAFDRHLVTSIGDETSSQLVEQLRLAQLEAVAGKTLYDVTNPMQDAKPKEEEVEK